jgi:pimeloyl-ACP methyl ester carboxylesterase
MTRLETISARSRDGVRLHVEVHGNPDGPTLVLSHGWTCSIRFWLPLIAELADQRGHGLSDRAPGSGRRDGWYGVPALAEDLAAVLDAAAAPGPGPVILVGHSMGGMTIMAAGESVPVLSRTRAILLVSTGASDLATTTGLAPGRLGRHLARRMLRGATPLGPPTWLSARLLAYGTLGPGSGRALKKENAAIIHACPRRTRAGWGRVLETLDVREGAARLAVPTAVLVGSADRLTPPRHTDRIVALLPQLHSSTRLPGIGHMAPMEKPAAIAALIRELDAATAVAPAPPSSTVPAAISSPE